MIHLAFVRFAISTSEERQEIYRAWVARCYSVAYENLVLEKSPSGKPSLRNQTNGETYFFSSSHSADSLLFGVSREEDFAVDVEAMGQRKKRDSVLRRFFSPEEGQFVEASPDPDRAFLWLWTRRESLIKNTGEGLAAITKKVSVLTDEVEFDGELYFLQSDLPLEGESKERFVFSFSARKKNAVAPSFTLDPFVDLEQTKNELKIHR